MENNAKNISTGKPKAKGAIFTAPPGTPIPTDGVAPLDAKFENLGYISEDGVINGVKISTQETTAWGGDVVMSSQSSHNETYKFKCLETNVVVLKECYGEDNVTVDQASMHVRHTSGEGKLHPFVIETVEPDGRICRTVIPNGKLGERGDIVRDGKNPVAYDMTVTALPDITGAKAHDYYAMPEA